jgi:hypothetical protein
VDAFTAQPADAELLSGETAIFQVGAPDGARLQWQSSRNGSAWHNLAGETGATLSFAAVKPQNGMQYRCVAINFGDVRVYSEAATITITDVDPNAPRYGDADGNDDVDSADAARILRHVVQLESISADCLPLADVDADDEITSSDAAEVLRYIVYLTDWFPAAE